MPSSDWRPDHRPAAARSGEKADLIRRVDGVQVTEVQKAVRGVDYPPSKDELASHAERNGADRELVDALRGMNKRSLDGPNAVLKELKGRPDRLSGLTPRGGWRATSTGDGAAGGAPPLFGVRAAAALTGLAQTRQSALPSRHPYMDTVGRQYDDRRLADSRSRPASAVNLKSGFAKIKETSSQHRACRARVRRCA
jgi:Protein of unknown function (DUF2795)